ncbi:MAG: WG repeat-containing protein [Clostridiales bacterium]|nr:WG repeat-containing protein [Clostridiales bacterium]
MMTGRIRRMRRVLTLILALSLLAAGPALAAPMVVSLDADQLLVDVDGATVTELGRYDAVYPLAESFATGGDALFAAAGDNGKYALVNGGGKRLTDFAYEGLRLEQGCVVFTEGGRIGAMDAKGSVVVPAQYTMLTPVGGGAFLALRTDPYDDAADGVYLVDAQGGEKATGAKVIYGLGAMSGGLIAATSSQDGRYGYLNAQGQWAIEPQYNYCGPFVGDYADAAISAGVGIINRAGNWVVTPKYSSASVGYPDRGAPFVVFDQDGAVTLISSSDFKAIETLRGDGIWAYALDNGLVVASGGDRQTVYDYQGQALFTLDAGWDLNAWASEGDLAIAVGGDWGDADTWLIDLTGQKVAGPYQSLQRLGRLDGEPVFEYDTFEVMAVPSADGATTYNQQRAGTFRAGVIDGTGKVLIEARYDSLVLVGDGVLRAETPQYFALLNFRGEELARLERYGALLD